MTTKKISTISQLVNLIDDENINDLETINDLCRSMFGDIFCPIQFSNTRKSKYYYMSCLMEYANEINRDGFSKRSFIDFAEPFNIKNLQ